MKITGDGSGWGRQQQGHGGRADAFRRKRRVGDKVSGRLLRWERQGLAWIDFEGQTLLARLASSPPLGETLLFIITSLDPEIQLREIGPASGEAAASNAARTFTRARTRFDSGPWNQAMARLDPASTWQRRRAAFFAILERDPDGFETWLDATAAVRDLSLALEAGGHGRAVWLPWLIPGAKRLEILHRARPDGGTEMIAGFVLDEVGACRIMAMAGGGSPGVTLGLPKGTPREMAERLGETVGRHIGGNIPLKGVVQLPPDASGGPLAELVALLHKARGRGSTGLNLKA